MYHRSMIIDSITNTLQTKKTELEKLVKTKLREKALLRTKARLVENGIDINDLDEEELEIIIKDEEDKLIDNYKTNSIVVLAALLGVSLV